MKKAKISIILLLFLLIFFPFKTAFSDTVLPSEDYAAKGASLFIQPEKSRFLDPEYLTLNLIVDPAGIEINAASAYLSFDAAKLQLVQSNKENSFCEFFIAENTNNSLGRYDLSCAALDVDAGTSSELVRLIFKKLDTGWTKLEILDNSQVLARDGIGIDILGAREIHNIYLFN